MEHYATPLPTCNTPYVPAKARERCAETRPICAAPPEAAARPRAKIGNIQPLQSRLWHPPTTVPVPSSNLGPVAPGNPTCLQMTWLLRIKLYARPYILIPVTFLAQQSNRNKLRRNRLPPANKAWLIPVTPVTIALGIVSEAALG